MGDSTDPQGLIVGVGLIVTVVVIFSGTLTGDTVGGIDTMVVVGWVFTAMLFALAGVHAIAGTFDLTWGFGGAGMGWLFILVGEGTSVVIGSFVLFLSVVYIALVTRRLRRTAKTARESQATEES